MKSCCLEVFEYNNMNRGDNRRNQLSDWRIQVRLLCVRKILSLQKAACYNKEKWNIVLTGDEKNDKEDF
jgi:hypothetical protein